MSDVAYLIVQQYPQPPAHFDDFLRQLAQRHQLDIFLSRQRLIGRGISRFAQGETKDLEKISVSLLDGRIGHWLVVPQASQLPPKRIYALQTEAQKMVFQCRDSEVVFPGGSRVLAVLADVSGTLADKLLSRVISSNAYLGRDATRQLDQDQLCGMILQGMPVLDLYLLDEDQQISAAVRVFPGRYNPAGLGERATLSSRQNLKALLELVQAQAAEFQLHTGFGLDNLPGCQIRRAEKNDAEALRLNLLGLTRYGWLMIDLWRCGLMTPSDIVKSEGTSEMTPLVTLLAAPVAGMAEAHPLTAEIRRALRDDESVASPSASAEPARLPPPPAAVSAGWTPARIWSTLGFFGGAAAVFFLLVADQSDPLDRILYHGFASGAGPLGFASLFLWFGFYKLRIKRKMENTPTSRIRSVAMGMVEVKGRTLRQYALVSPMSHLPCVFYRLTRYRRDKNNRWRVVSVTGSDNVPFLLEDDTGRVEIDPRHATVRAGTRHEGVPGQIGLTRGISDSDEKWVEETIIEGTLLYVLGYASVKKDNRLTSSDKVQAALRELKQNPHRLKEFDANGDGHICADEWDAARAATEEKVLRQVVVSAEVRKRQEDHIIIGKHKGQPLVIAETHCEDHLTARYRNEAVFLFVLSAGATGLAIHLLMSYL